MSHAFSLIVEPRSRGVRQGRTALRARMNLGAVRPREHSFYHGSDALRSCVHLIEHANPPRARLEACPFVRRCRQKSQRKEKADHFMHKRSASRLKPASAVLAVEDQADSLRFISSVSVRKGSRPMCILALCRYLRTSPRSHAARDGKHELTAEWEYPDRWERRSGLISGGGNGDHRIGIRRFRRARAWPNRAPG